jgi:predicted transcriptional regulator
MKKKMSDIVLQRASPPDGKTDLLPADFSNILVRRLGLKRKESRADHSKMLLELIKYKKDSIPLSVDQLSKILGVSQSQAYEEIRKWRSLGLIEFVKIPSGNDFVKGYMLTANTCNRLMDRVESSLKAFMRKTRRISKDMDDLLMLESARKEKGEKSQEEQESVNSEESWGEKEDNN